MTISKTAKHYMRRKKIVPTPTRAPKYETGTLKVHNKPVEEVNPIFTDPESPGTTFRTE